jgi:hypothetical protein
LENFQALQENPRVGSASDHLPQEEGIKEGNRLILHPLIPAFSRWEKERSWSFYVVTRHVLQRLKSLLWVHYHHQLCIQGITLFD